MFTAHTAGVDTQSRDDMALSAAQAIVSLSRGEWPAEKVRQSGSAQQISMVTLQYHFSFNVKSPKLYTILRASVAEIEKYAVASLNARIISIRRSSARPMRSVRLPTGESISTRRVGGSRP